MCAGIEHDENKILISLLPNQQPIGLNVTFPLPLAVTMQDVGMEHLGKFAVNRKKANHLMQLPHVVTAALAQPHLALELASISNGVHRRLIEYLLKQVIHILRFIDSPLIKVTQRAFIG